MHIDVAVNVARSAAWLTLLGLAICCAVIIDIAGVVMPIVSKPDYVVDFTVFWAAARIDPSLVYDANALSLAQVWITGPAGLRPFAYPPTFLALLEPFGWLAHFPSFLVWSVISVALYAWATFRMVPPPAALLALLSPAVLVCLHMGQSSLIIGAILIAGLTCLPTRPIVAGVLLGIGATLKPQALVLVPLALVAARDWRALAATLMTGGAVGLASIAVLGPQIWLDWLASLQGFMQVVEKIGLPERSLTPASLILWLGLEGPTATVCRVACGLLGTAAVFKVFRRSENPAERLAAVVAGGFLCTPYAMPYEAAMIQPAVAAMLLDRKAHPTSWIAPFLFFTTMLAPMASLFMAVTLLFSPGSERRPAGLWLGERARVA